jgi:hypothetical protein
MLNPMKNKLAIKDLPLIIIGTFLFGIINLIFHFVTDWHLGILIGKRHGIDLTADPYSNLNLVIWNSLYSGSPTELLIYKTLALAIAAGYFMTATVVQLRRKEKLKAVTLIITIITWLIKIPITVEDSNFIGIYSMLLAW